MRRNKFFDEPPKKPKSKGLGISGNDLSKRQERRIATRSGGKRTPASGSLPFAKGDVEAGINLIECKTTAKKSMRIEQKWLTKIVREARGKGKEAGLVVSFSDIPSDIDQDWIMIPFALFKRLADAERAQFE